MNTTNTARKKNTLLIVSGTVIAVLLIVVALLAVQLTSSRSEQSQPDQSSAAPQGAESSEAEEQLEDISWSKPDKKYAELHALKVINLFIGGAAAPAAWRDQLAPYVTDDYKRELNSFDLAHLTNEHATGEVQFEPLDQDRARVTVQTTIGNFVVEVHRIEDADSVRYVTAQIDRPWQVSDEH